MLASSIPTFFLFLHAISGVHLKPLPTLPTAIIKLWLDAAVEGDEQMTVELEKDKKKTTGKKIRQQIDT